MIVPVCAKGSLSSAIISSKHRRRRCLHNSATWAPVVADIFVVHGVVVEVVVVDVGVTAAADDAHVPANVVTADATQSCHPMHAAAYKVTAPASDAVAADATESCHPMHAAAYKPPLPLH